MNECDEDLEFFLHRAAEDPPQWFEVWVDMTAGPDGILGVAVRGSRYGHIHFDEEASKIGQFMWNVDGLTWGTPRVGDAVRSLFD